MIYRLVAIELCETACVSGLFFNKISQMSSLLSPTWQKRDTSGSGNESQQCINSLKKYAELVEYLMKLTRNKRHFYQRGRASCNLASSKVPSYIFHPPG